MIGLIAVLGTILLIVALGVFAGIAEFEERLKMERLSKNAARMYKVNLDNQRVVDSLVDADALYEFRTSIVEGRYFKKRPKP